ncbi:hypothetical protein CTAYLR_005114 [Chrysophaeum taylorii]|uniref:Ubiquitin-activating enzyme E1 C-terminal domain-containing protein n=1 Tax=Chrysophaeum taylorii TaxID=2483200 RepID=A0AAD7UFK5_9STRA|nr:hypothetical protein CTAYLR_005114 [Chrysophaeum taylorii]
MILVVWCTILTVASALARARWVRGGGSSSSSSSSSVEVDEELYSRQLLAFGRDAQGRLSEGRVLVVGCGGVGIEVCKNLALAGVGSLGMWDDGVVGPGEWQLFASTSDEGRRRSDASVSRVAELNPYCRVRVVERPECFDFDCVVACSVSAELVARLGAECRDAGVGFVYAGVRNATEIVVADDFGDGFEAVDREVSSSFSDPKLVEEAVESGEVVSVRLAGGERHDCQAGDRVFVGSDGPFEVTAVPRPDRLTATTTTKKKNKNNNNNKTMMINTTTSSEMMMLRAIPSRVVVDGEAVTESDAVDDDERATPLRAVAGGVAAHEALKYLAGGLLGPPVGRWTMDVSEELGPEEHDLDEASAFVVGAGATGCELLKNLALMGVGRVVVADDDAIETSNLNRQFLFRACDVGKPKALVAAERARAMGTSTRVEGVDKRVDSTSSALFEREVVASAACVFSALDNLEARRFLDRLCVAHARPFVDTGTLGARGSVQVCVPHVTETYSNSQDPEDAGAVPLCTLKQHPYKIDHVVSWAADVYDGYFNRRVKRLEALLRSYERAGGVRTWLRSLGGEQDLQALSAALEDVCDLRSPSPDAWAAREFSEHFVNSVRSLQSARPRDALDDDDGMPYWTGTRVWPRAAETTDDDFVRSAARLRAATLGVDDPPPPPPPPSTPDPAGPSTVEDLELSLARLVHATGRAPAEIAASLKPRTFDKDNPDDLAFVAAAANARARVFSIPPADPLRVKQIAGSVVPAIATTTAVVSGLAALEFLKLRNDGKPMNAFVNLAIPDTSARAEPFPCDSWTLPDGTLVSDWSPRAHLNLPTGATVPKLLDLIVDHYFPDRRDVHVASIARESDGDLLYLAAFNHVYAKTPAADLLLATDDDDRPDDQPPRTGASASAADDLTPFPEEEEEDAAPTFVDLLVTVAPGHRRHHHPRDDDDADIPLPPIRLWIDNALLSRHHQNP